MTFHSAKELIGKKVKLRHEYLGEQGYCPEGHVFKIVRVTVDHFHVEDDDGKVLRLLPGWFDFVGD